MTKNRLWDELVPEALRKKIEGLDEVRHYWAAHEAEWRERLPTGTRVILMEQRRHVAYADIGEWGTVITHDDDQGVYASKGRGAGIRWDNGFAGYVSPLVIWTQEEYEMEREELIIVVEYDGLQQQVKIRQQHPRTGRYEKKYEMPVAVTQTTPYEVTVYVDGIEMSVDEAKRLSAEIIHEPVRRAKILRQQYDMQHDSYWNVVFIADKLNTAEYGILRGRYENGQIELEIGKPPRLRAMERDEYPVEATKAVYRAKGMTFVDVSPPGNTEARAYVGKTDIDVEAGQIARTITKYLRRVMQKSKRDKERRSGAEDK